MRTALIVPLAALTLAGCGGTTPTSNSTATTETSATTATTASANTTATTTTTKTTATATTTGSGMPTAASLGIKPGKWANTVQILDMDVQGEGMTPAISARMKQAIAARPPETVTSCLSAEEAAKGPSAAMLDKAHCSFTKADTGGGHISTAMSCDMPGGKLTSQGEGVYSPTGYTVDGHGSMTGRMSMTMHTRTTGKWLGECDGSEVNAKGRK
jgi:hypothetical protein